MLSHDIAFTVAAKLNDVPSCDAAFIVIGFVDMPTDGDPKSVALEGRLDFSMRV